MNHARDALDTTICIVTPENVEFSYRLAGPFRRLVAYVVDLLIMGILIVGALMIVSQFVPGHSGLGVFFLLFFFVTWGYGCLLETFWNGQTLGKKTVGIRVVSTEGLPIRGWQAVLRNIVRAADLWPYLWPAALSMLWTKRFQRLGDLAADTMVVVDEPERLRQIPRLKGIDPELAAAIPASFEARAETADALANYIGRRDLFPPARREEMARHLADPLVARFHLPASTDPDMLLCALYQRVFIE